MRGQARQSRKLWCWKCQANTEHHLYATPGRSVLEIGNWRCLPCKRARESRKSQKD